MTPPPVWKDADEAAYKWKKQDPDRWINLIRHSLDVANNPQFSSDYKVGYMETALELIEGELKLRKAEGRW